MTQYVEDITVGLNKFTPERWRRVFDTVQKFESLLPQLESALFAINEPLKLFFPALILGYKRISASTDNRFSYAWHEAVENETDDQFNIKSGGLNSYTDFNAAAPNSGGPFTSPARNMIENGNIGDGVVSGGVNIDGEDYPDRFCMMAIRGGGGSSCCADIDGCQYSEGDTDGPATWFPAAAPCVPMFLFRTDTGKPLPSFALMNQHDGSCMDDPPPPQGATTSSPVTTAPTVVRTLVDYTVVDNNVVILADASKGALTISIGAAGISLLDRRIYVKKVDPSNNAVTVAGTSSKIDGSSSFDITTQYDSLTLVSDDANWFIV